MVSTTIDEDAGFGFGAEEVGSGAEDKKRRGCSEIAEAVLDSKTEEAGFSAVDDIEGKAFDCVPSVGDVILDERERGGNVVMMFGSFLTITTLLTEISPCTRLHLSSKNLSSIDRLAISKQYM